MIEKLKEWSGVIALLAIILFLIISSSSPEKMFGAVGSRFPNGLGVGSATMQIGVNKFQASSTALFTGPVIIGPDGGTLNELKGTTCNLLNADTSIAASSTGYAYCTGITGLASGDVVLTQLSSTTPVTSRGGWSIQAAKASTTAGAIDIMIFNAEDRARIPSAFGVGSSTNIWYIDN